MWLVSRVAKPMFYCTGKQREKWLHHCSHNGRREPTLTQCRFLVWECWKAKIKINQNLYQRMKTIIQRKTGPARRDDLLLKAKINLESSMGTQNTSDKKTDFAGRDVNLSFNIYMEIYKEKQDRKLVPIC